jgi:hypothetical protein
MGVFSYAWIWLDTNSKQIGALSSIAFGLSSAVVAWVALRLSILNSLGSKPIVLFVSQGVGRVGEDGVVFESECVFEFWNRRKHPLIVQWVLQFWTWATPEFWRSSNAQCPQIRTLPGIGPG